MFNVIGNHVFLRWECFFSCWLQGVCECIRKNVCEEKIGKKFSGQIEMTKNFLGSHINGTLCSCLSCGFCLGCSFSTVMRALSFWLLFAYVLKTVRTQWGVKRDQKWLKYQIRQTLASAFKSWKKTLKKKKKKCNKNSRQNFWSTFQARILKRQFHKSLTKIVFSLRLIRWKRRRWSILFEKCFCLLSLCLVHAHGNAWTGSCCSGKLVLYYLFNCYIIFSRHFSPDLSCAHHSTLPKHRAKASLSSFCNHLFFCCMCVCLNASPFLSV